MQVAPEDFPQMWERPCYFDLISLLRALELVPPIWHYQLNPADVLAQQESAASKHKSETIRYLSTIVSSPLTWIITEEQREEVWTLASKRMSERCGRTAMGEVVRRWPLKGTETDSDPFELVIREPALVGDSLGFKTWGSSYVLAQQLPRLAQRSLFRLFDETMGQASPDVLELGSGTGLLGIAAAALWGVSVTLSDLPEIVPNLQSNVQANLELVLSKGGGLKAGALTWGGKGEDEIDQNLFADPNHFKILLAADPLYDDNHPSLLASAISQHLAYGSDARAVVMVPQRDHTTERLRDSFKQALLDLEAPIFCDEEDELTGQDDWTEDEARGHVKCWLGIFSRGGSPSCGLSN